MRPVAIALTLLAYAAGADAQTPSPLAPIPFAPAPAVPPTPDAVPPIASPPQSVPQEGSTRQRSTKNALHKRSMTADVIANPPNSLNGFGLPQDAAKQPPGGAMANHHTAPPAAEPSTNYDAGSPEFLAAQTRLRDLRNLEDDLIQFGFRSYVTTAIDFQHPERRSHPEILQLKSALDAYASRYNLDPLSIDNDADRKMVHTRLRAKIKQEIEEVTSKGTDFTDYAGAYSANCTLINGKPANFVGRFVKLRGLMFMYFVGNTAYFSTGFAGDPNGEIRYVAEPILHSEQQTMTWHDGHVSQGTTFTLSEREGTSKIFFDGSSMEVMKTDGAWLSQGRCSPEFMDD